MIYMVHSIINAIFNGIKEPFMLKDIIIFAILNS
jgi:hypothetical protein